MVRWYVLQVKPGAELRTRNALHELGFPAAVPQEVALIRKGGEWHEQERILFGGYVFVAMEYTANNYYKATATVGVSRFLCAGGVPSPLSFLEEEWIKLLTFEGVALRPTKVTIGEDNELVVVDGIMKHFTNRPLSVDKHKRRATFEITVCGEAKTVELSIETI